MSCSCMVCEMGGKYLYSSYFVGYCLRDLFKIAHSILVLFQSSFFSIYFISIQVVHPCSSSDTATTWKKSSFISSERSDFHMIDILLLVIHAFDRHMLPRYMNWSTNFRGVSLIVEMASFYLKHMDSVLFAFM